ncbi:pyridoxamine 5'-phosphate oxidase family protein [Burkholderia sp. THE68]|uniref:pyridoxamine 5'-phosphate oxidase family protein n=1 Tax=Burkholderia sp. THE68 TaxID=758782 RepID=UPI0018D8091B|nr:pyridoxamine 5'-phosphate oxidase family protein [Burkholderia sp. THE68]
MNDRTNEVSSPWHEGELFLQASAGVVEAMDDIARRHLRDHLIQQHKTFFPLLPFIVVGVVDTAGYAWATILCGHPGFCHAIDDVSLRVNATFGVSDPAASGLQNEKPIGLLGIALDTGRRNRLNGLIRRDSNLYFDVQVAQSFGNCARYIQRRDSFFARRPDETEEGLIEILTTIGNREANLIRRSTAMFIASYLDRQGVGRQVDVSHRGGKSGFVRVTADGSLTLPDFSGNNHFATLGNILLNPNCGFLFVDFETGDTLQMSGNGEVIFDSTEIQSFTGAERLLRFRPRQIIYRRNALPIRFRTKEGIETPGWSSTGKWAE